MACLCTFLLVLLTFYAVEGKLYAVHVNETTQKVAVRQILYDNDAKGELSQWQVYMGQNEPFSRYIGYSTMDVRRDIFINQYKQAGYFFSVNIKNSSISLIPAPYLFDMFRYLCLSVDSEDHTLLAIDAYTNKVNSIDWTTGNFTPIMDINNITTARMGDGYTLDSKHKIIYSLSLDFLPPRESGITLKDDGYTNVLNIINFKEKTERNQTVSCQYKIGGIHYHPHSDTLYGMEYEAGWLLKDQPTNTTIYIGKINQDTWNFDRLVELAVPFYSNQYLSTFCASRGHFILLWPQPDYSPYNENNNGVLQVIDIVNNKVLYNDQVQEWYMTTRFSENNATPLVSAVECSDT